MQPTQSMPEFSRTPRKRSRAPLAIVVVVALLAAAGITSAGLYLGGVFATEFVAQPFDDPGIDPFGGSVGDGQSVPITPVADIKNEAATVPPVTDPARVTPAQPAAPSTKAATAPSPSGLIPGLPGPSATPTGNTVSGDVPGLYGGTNQNACDAPKLVAFLQANPDKAKAWADVELVPVDQIGAFVATLTPMILRTDTAVINHGFRNGVANPFNAVLQAGTAVMVDRNGVPRVRCKCGNPLLPPKSFSQVKYTGTKWLGFDERNITIIQRSAQPISAFRVYMLCNCGYGPPTNTAIPFNPTGSTVPGTGTGTGTRGGTGTRRTTTAPVPGVTRTPAPNNTGGGTGNTGGGGGDTDGDGGTGDTGTGSGSDGGDNPAPPRAVPPQTPAG